MNFLDGAPCVGLGHLFFAPNHGETFAERRDRVAAAIDVCRTCPLIEQCREGARQRGEAHGIWAGVDLDSRRKKPDPRRRGPGPQPIVHGSPNGAKAHYRRGEQPCDQCVAVNNPRRGTLWSVIGPLRHKALRFSWSLRNNLNMERAL